jgi:hypothetical protein
MNTINFEDKYSRMDNDELLRLTSEWTTLTEPAQMALAAEMEKRKLGNQFKAERQIALEKPTSPSRNRLTTWLVIGIAVWSITGFLKSLEQSPTAAASERYNGGDFTMIVPAGSTPVKMKNSAQPVDGQQVVRNDYSFRNGSTSYGINRSDYSTERAENTPEEVLKEIASVVFNAGYSANFYKSHLGALPAAACELEGTTIKGKPAFIRIRAALSEDRKRMWMTIVNTSDRQSFPASQAEEFMESIGINPR